MPDITMCKSKDCPERENCYRYKAIPTPYWQSYSDFSQDCAEYDFRNFLSSKGRERNCETY